MFLRQSEPTAAFRTRMFVLKASDGVTAFTSALSGSDLQLSKAGAVLGNAVGAATHLANGLYKLVLDVTDLDSLGELVLVVVKTGVQSIALSLGQVTPTNPYSPRYSGTVAAGTLSASSFPSTATSAAADHWRDSLCRFITGGLAGQVRRINGNSTSGVLTLAPDAFNGAPSVSDIFELINV